MATRSTFSSEDILGPLNMQSINLDADIFQPDYLK